MLTTLDNPYNPWVNYDAWYTWDTEHGYNTNQYLSRIADTMYTGNEEDEESITAEAIALIIEQDITGNYRFQPKPDNFDEESDEIVVENTEKEIK